MKIVVKKNWKDLVEGPAHATLSRRDFLSRGLATGSATILLPTGLAAALSRAAQAGATNCPPQTRQAGALAQLIRDGGPTVGAMFLNSTQANGLNATVAGNYGIVQASVQQFGANWWLDAASPFAFGLTQPPPGYTATSWAAVLKKTSLGGHYGPFNSDDGAGQNLGMPGGAGPMKPSTLGRDIRLNNSETLANWANGLPSTKVNGNLGDSSLTPTTLASKFSMTPSNKTNSQIMTNSAGAADSLSQIFASVFGVSGRKYGPQAVAKAVCGFYGDSVMASPTFGTSLFDPTQVTALMSATIQPSKLTMGQQAMLATFYQSAIGSIGAVVYEQNGCDYHGQSLQTTIAPSDLEAGMIVAMFIAACDAAQVPGAMILTANGQAIAGGTATTATVTDINGVTQNVTARTTAQGDAGGSYNAGMILAYHPSSPPQLQSTGTFEMSNGNVKVASQVGSVPSAIAGLYFTAFSYLGLDVSALTSTLQVAGISNPSSLSLIS